MPARAEDGAGTDLVVSARTHYAAGVAAYSAGRFREAVDEFIAADRLAARPALSYNIARAYDRLGDAAKALQYYREYLRREAEPANAAEIKNRVRELEASLAQNGVQQLSVRSEPSGASLRIDDRLVGTTPWTGELQPGAHRLTLTLPDYEEHARAFELLAVHATDIDVRLEASVASAAPVPPSVAASSGRIGCRPGRTRGRESSLRVLALGCARYRRGGAGRQSGFRARPALGGK